MKKLSVVLFSVILLLLLTTTQVKAETTSRWSTKNPEKLIDYVFNHANKFKLNGNNLLYLDKKKSNIFERCNTAILVLQNIMS